MTTSATSVARIVCWVCALGGVGCTKSPVFYGALTIQQPASVCRPVVGEVAPVENVDLRWKWSEGSNPSFNQNMATPMVADIDGDGVSDFVFTTFATNQYAVGGVLRVVSGADGREIWSTSRGASESVFPFGSAAPAVYDLDADGSPEILVAAQSTALAAPGLAVYSAKGALLGFSRIDGVGYTASVQVSDANGDGTPEVIVGIVSGHMYPLDVKSWQLGSPVLKSVGVYGTMELVKSSPGQELVTATAVYSSDGLRKLYDLPKRSQGAGSPRGVAFGRFDSDGETDLVLLHGSPLSAQIVKGASGTLIGEWKESDADQQACAKRSPGSASISGAPNAGDVDADGLADVTFAGRCKFYALKSTGSGLKELWSLETRDFSSAVTGSSIYDFNGDGRVEALYNDELFFRILDGRTGKVLYSLRNDNGTLWENPVVASLRSGEPASVILSANSYTRFTEKDDPSAFEDPEGKIQNLTGLRVIQGGANRWMPTRTVWNQHLYTITNVLDRLLVPSPDMDFLSLSNLTRANIPQVVLPCVSE